MSCREIPDKNSIKEKKKHNKMKKTDENRHNKCNLAVEKIIII